MMIVLPEDSVKKFHMKRTDFFFLTEYKANSKILLPYERSNRK